MCNYGFQCTSLNFYTLTEKILAGKAHSIEGAQPSPQIIFVFVMLYKPSCVNNAVSYVNKRFKLRYFMRQV